MELTTRQTVAIFVLFGLVTAAYIGYMAYQTRNKAPFERGSQQYEGWQYAEMNQLTDASECEDKDGGWAALGIETSEGFVAGCREWFRR